MNLYLRLPLGLVFGLFATFSCPRIAAKQATTSSDSPASIVINVNRVLIPVVVRNKAGHAVGNLTKADFQVFDDDAPQPISGFSVEARAVTKGGAEIAAEPRSAAGPEILPSRIVVFLFDDLHLSAEDMFHARIAGAKAVTSALSDSDMAAIVSTSGKTNSVLTRDRAKLQEAIKSLKPRAIFRSSLTDCPYIPYYQANLIEDKHDSQALAEAIRQVFNCDPSLDKREIDIAQRLAESTAMQVQMVGHQDVQATYAIIHEVVRRMASLPGQRSLILVSPGFLTIEPDTLTSESQIIDLAAQSNVAISAVDVRGVYTTSVTASQQSFGDAQFQADMRRTSMQAAENPMAELADGTGAAFFHNRNDLDAGLDQIAEPPEYLYLLEISPDNARPDGSYHRLRVKVNPPGMQIQARRGYFVPKPKKEKK